MGVLDQLKTKIFADGADLAGILELAGKPWIKGFTTNPTLMRKAGVDDYTRFARQLLAEVTEHPISFEVFADEVEGMRTQAKEIASWGDNVYVKIPVTNTEGVSMAGLVRELSQEGIKVNVTAVFTLPQVEQLVTVLADGAGSNVSIFAGRIADAGVDPVPIMKEALEILDGASSCELIWASPREILNLIQADQIGCHIITMTHDLLAKLSSLGKDLGQFSLDTVKMFHGDAQASGFDIATVAVAASTASE